MVKQTKVAISQAKRVAQSATWNPGPAATTESSNPAQTDHWAKTLSQARRVAPSMPRDPEPKLKRASREAQISKSDAEP